ncbi:MAG: flavodoxin-dependent (E)-4-hydroxy-3-methylbut-2-enyl-diphosphate synthase [Clostridia bacterium]
MLPGDVRARKAHGGLLRHFALCRMPGASMFIKNTQDQIVASTVRIRIHCCSSLRQNGAIHASFIIVGLARPVNDKPITFFGIFWRALALVFDETRPRVLSSSHGARLCARRRMKDRRTAEMRKTRSFLIGGVPIGGGAPVTVQSMTNTDSRNAEETLAQVRALAAAGCDIVRLSVYDELCLAALPAILAGSPVPLVADIHYRADLAVGAMELGVAKVRINPGNIGSMSAVRRVADCAKAHGVPIRIGVNSGSIEKEILARDGGVTARGMVDSALSHARLLEEAGFHDIVLSLKASSVPLSVAAYELAAAETDYPLHVGITEAGLPGAGNIKSAVGIGALLLRGIGDTIRVSLTGSPIPEAQAAIDILKAVGLRRDYVNVISCPTCGRTGIDVAAIAQRASRELADIRVPLTVAVMGCVVNGPGEAREADVGIAGGGLSASSTAGGANGGYSVGALFEKGKPPIKVEGDLAGILIQRAREIAREKEA